MSDVTRILNQIESGDWTGAEQLPPLVDKESFVVWLLSVLLLSVWQLSVWQRRNAPARSCKLPRSPVARLLLSQSLSDHADKHDGQLEFVRSLSSGKRVWNCLKARAARLPGQEEIDTYSLLDRSLGTPNSSEISSGSHLRGERGIPRIRPGSLRGNMVRFRRRPVLSEDDGNKTTSEVGHASSYSAASFSSLNRSAHLGSLACAGSASRSCSSRGSAFRSKSCSTSSSGQYMYFQSLRTRASEAGIDSLSRSVGCSLKELGGPGAGFSSPSGR